MASQSSKKTASSNANTLKELHLISIAVNLLALLVLLVFKRPSSKWAYLIFSLPAFFCQYTLEKSGRPIYGLENGYSKLIKPGQDLKGEGLFEYMFDCIYITWLIDLLMIVFGSNKVWWLYSVIPGYAAYKAASIAKSFFGGGAKGAENSNNTKEEQTSSTKSSNTKSKRQTKLEARREKGQVQVKRR